MPDNYCRLSQVQRALTGGTTVTSFNTQYLEIMDACSRALDDRLNRHFYSYTETRYLNPDGRKVEIAPGLWRPGLELRAGGRGSDLISVTTLKVDEDGDGTFELTLTENTDFWLWPQGRLNTPARAIVVNPESDNISSFPVAPRSVEIAGKWGYSEETESATTLAEELDATETAVDVVSGTAVEAGETILVDSEQMYISSIATNTLTVVRGHNGTTAATHANGATVSRRRYPRPIELAVTLEVARFWRVVSSGASDRSGGGEFGFDFRASYPAIRSLDDQYRLVAV